MNRAQAKGTRGETLIVETLKPVFPGVERRAKQGYRDRGDIGGIVPHLVIEAKCQPGRYRIAEWLHEADHEALNDTAELAVVWFKLKSVGNPLDWPVMMRGRFFVPMLWEWAASRVPQRSSTNQLKLFDDETL